MRDDYLWDRSGPPDPDVRELEEALARFRHDPSTAPRFDAPEPSRTRLWLTGAAAAVFIAALAASIAMYVREQPATADAWKVTSVAGRPTIGTDHVYTDDDSRARIEVGRIGVVEVQSRTRVRLVEAAARRYRLGLDRGTVHAMIWSPPGVFLMDTPSAVAVDLGCAYTLTVDDDGNGVLTVESGWVAFENDGRESFVPAGARCATRRARGPGTPHYLDAPTPLQSAVAVLDAGPDAVGRRRALDDVLAHARARDALTLWHLLARTTGGDRARVHDRLAALVPPPAGVTRDGVLEGRQEMLDAWWDELDLSSIDFWRRWKQDWPSVVKDPDRYPASFAYAPTGARWPSPAPPVWSWPR